MTARPETRYARSGDVQIAYQVVGDGPIDLVFAVSFLTHVEFAWENPRAARFFERLASFSRLILFDKRGVGMSDPWTGELTIEQRADDIRAVLDAVGSDRAALFGSSEGGTQSIVHAALFPERTSALILFSPALVALADEESPWAWTPEHFQLMFDSMEASWNTGAGVELINPSLAGDDHMREWYARYWRLCASPATARALLRANMRADIRPLLPTIVVPTLVIHRTDESWMSVENSRYAASRIPGARLVELPGTDHYPWEQDPDGVVDEVEEFLTGTRHGPAPDRVLATVLFTDLVDSTARAAAAGDRSWRDVLDLHDQCVRQQVERSGGRVVKSTGDGVLATFDSPARAVRCAHAIRDEVRSLGLEVRAGVHSGEIERRDGDVSGFAVNLGSRVMSSAQPGEVLVSRTVVDLVAGSGIVFEDRGVHDLKGVPGEWRLFAVTG